VNTHANLTPISAAKSNLHTHTAYCDGKGEPEEFVKKAISLGFERLGFSSHAPLPFPNDWTLKRETLPLYIREINRLKQIYGNRIEILAGLEVDYIPGLIGPSSFKDIKNSNGESLDFDYILGSVHFLPVKTHPQKYLEIDFNPGQMKMIIDEGYGGDSRAMIRAYYGLVREMLTIDPPTILGHLDLVKKFNRGNVFFNENDSFYHDEIEKTLDVLKKTSTILEVNTAPIYRGYDTEPYPSNVILKMCREYNIPVVLNSDAHSPDVLDGGYAEALRILQE
jgi:histidinol-phosphatase (PHP family)